LTDCIIDIDSTNSGLASKIAVFFQKQKYLSSIHQLYMKQCVGRILQKKDLSDDVRVTLSLS